MSERYYDLNSRENCTAAVIKIADKEFKIDRVVIGARLLYSNHLKRMGKLLKETGDLEEKDEEALKALVQKAEDFQIEKMETYDKILALLLSKNGYSYDKAWWEENTDEIDQRTFIERCMMKDSDTDKKKERAIAAK